MHIFLYTLVFIIVHSTLVAMEKTPSAPSLSFSRINLYSDDEINTHSILKQSVENIPEIYKNFIISIPKSFLPRLSDNNFLYTISALEKNLLLNAQIKFLPAVTIFDCVRKNDAHALWYIILPSFIELPDQYTNVIIHALACLINTSMLNDLKEKITKEMEHIKTIRILNNFTSYYEKNSNEKNFFADYKHICETIRELPIEYIEHIKKLSIFDDQCYEFYFYALANNDLLIQQLIESMHPLDKNIITRLEYSLNLLRLCIVKYTLFLQELTIRKNISDEELIPVVKQFTRILEWFGIERNLCSLTNKDLALNPNNKRRLVALGILNIKLKDAAQTIAQALDNKHCTTTLWYWSIQIKRHQELETFLKPLVY